MLVILPSIASRFLRETSGTLHKKDPVCVLASDTCNCISSSRVWHLRAVVCLVSSSKLFSICATLPSSHPPSWLVAAVYDNVWLSLDFEPTGLKLSTVRRRSNICWLWWAWHLRLEVLNTIKGRFTSSPCSSRCTCCTCCTDLPGQNLGQNLG